MKDLRMRWWLLVLAPLTLISVTGFCVGLSVLPAFLLRDRAVSPWYFVVAGVILCGCAAFWCIVEFIRCFRGSRPRLIRILAIVLILTGLMLPGFIGAKKRSADTTVIPELALPPADVPGKANRTPSPP